MKVGIVIPGYNISRQLHSVLSKCFRHVPRRHIYVVDDGSTDKTIEIAREAKVVVHRHDSNLGKGAALKSGFRLALSDGLEGVISMDGDGQHDPDFIPSFLSVMQETGCDFVMGVRPFRLCQMPADRILSNRLSSLIVSSMVGQAIYDSQCGFRLFRRNVVEAIPLDTNHFETETELLVKAIKSGFRIGFCPISVVQTDYKSRIRRLPDTIRFCRLICQLLMEKR
jgi:glycosyltransferase involved in cell wall biosynthesis